MVGILPERFSGVLPGITHKKPYTKKDPEI
jgi:hypothetical protein